MRLQRDESISKIEISGRLVLGIYYDHSSGDSSRAFESFFESVHQQKLTKPLSLKGGADGQSLEKRSWNEGIARKLLRKLNWEV